MATFSNDDVRSVMTHLRYPYENLSLITSRLTEKTTLYGDSWVNEVLDLLTVLDGLKTTAEELAAESQATSISIAGEQSVTYAMNAMTAAYNKYNIERANLVKLTGISMFPQSTRIVC